MIVGGQTRQVGTGEALEQAAEAPGAVGCLPLAGGRPSFRSDVDLGRGHGRHRGAASSQQDDKSDRGPPAFLSGAARRSANRSPEALSDDVTGQAQRVVNRTAGTP